MQTALPDYGLFRPDLQLAVPGSDTVEVYKGHGKKRSDHEHAIGIVHGYLGRHTTGLIAGHLAAEGHDVFLVHNKLWRPEQRAKAAHVATKAAMQALGRTTVEYYVHSDGVRPIVDSAQHQQHRNPEDLSYTISRVTTVDGNGTNGLPFDFLELIGELEGLVSLAKKSPHATVRTYGQSVLNFIESPFSSSLQALMALRYDAREDIAQIEAAGVPVRVAFHDKDMVVRRPEDASLVLPGSHMSAIVQPDTMLELAA